MQACLLIGMANFAWNNHNQNKGHHPPPLHLFAKYKVGTYFIDSLSVLAGG